jgi:dephospho-CoA kinase
MTFVLGLTGGIGMGKSTTAQMFADEGVPVWDADAVVRSLYSPGQPGALAIARHYPQAMHGDEVDRPTLRRMIAEDPAILDHLNQLIHPLTARDRQQFLARHAGAPVVLLDIPLLFETGADRDCDAVAVVSVAPEVQRARVLARGQMTVTDLDLILSRQMPDAQKRARARWVIDTGSLDSARAAVRSILARIKGEAAHA